jgi:L-ascorbate 6-phosphate lactonase
MPIPTGAALVEQINSLTILPNSVAFWSLGQMGFVLKGSPQQIIYIDPYLSDLANALSDDDFGERIYPAPLQPQEVTNASAVLCTHEHLDHTDPDTLPGLAAASPQAQFYVSGWAREKVINEMGIAAERVHLLKAEQAFALGEARITPLPSAHYQLEHDAHKDHRWLGVLIEWNGVRLYHAGDTIIYPGYLDRLRALGPIDLAILPVNGRDWMREQRDVVGNLLPSEAVALAHELGWDLLIPGHNDLFKGNRIDPGQVFSEGRLRAPNLRIHQLLPGELYYYLK